MWAALSLSIFGSAQALTLNRPLVQSKQGEALRVEIDISDLSAAEQMELQADLASPEVYKAAKIEQPASNGAALDIQVQLLRRDNGRHFIKITSKQAVNTDAIDLLLDLRWANGRLIRDLSVSLDDAKAPAKPIHTPSLVGKEPTAKNTSQQLAVKRGDTASELVAKETPAGVSLEQMLVALLRNNPDAFVDANVNRMKEGALLTLPTEQEAQAVSRDEARRQIQVQAKDFDAYRAELAARAPGGSAPKVARDSAGKLDAKVQNKNAKTNQDKLTLATPGKKDNAAEEKIAQQREAQDVATRAAELSRNIAELGKIAAATVGGASEAASSGGVVAVDVPASAAEANGEWLNELATHPLTPVGAGSLIGLLVLIGLWRRRVNAAAANDDIHGLPPLNVKFNLDLPDHDPHDQHDHHEPIERAYIHDVTTHMEDAHAHPHDHVDEDDYHEEPKLDLEQPPRPTMEMPNISLDLDEPDTSASPYQVRIDLADELWNLGQLHTSKALMEEVANEASGAVKEKALKWLAERG